MIYLIQVTKTSFLFYICGGENDRVGAGGKQDKGEMVECLQKGKVSS